MGKLARRQWRVKVHGLAEAWATKSGGEVTADTVRVYDGGVAKPDVLAGPAQAGNVTVSRTYDPSRDQPIMRDLIQKVGVWRTSLHCQPLNPDMSVINGRSPLNYTQALLVGVTPPEPDASSGDGSVWSLEFAVSDWQISG